MGLHGCGCSQRGPPQSQSMGSLQVLNSKQIMKQHQPNQHRSSWSTSQRKLLAVAFISLLFCGDGLPLQPSSIKAYQSGSCRSATQLQRENIRKEDIEIRCLPIG